MSHAYSQGGPSECPPDDTAWVERYDAAYDAVDEALEAVRDGFDSVPCIPGWGTPNVARSIMQMQQSAKTLVDALGTLLKVVDA